MKKLLLTLGAVLSLVAPAMAADLPAQTPAAVPPVIVEPPNNWSGFYVGGNAGYAWGNANINATEVVENPLASLGFIVEGPPSGDIAAEEAASSPRLKPKGFTGGGQAGYNLQIGNIVLGAEADIEAFRLRSSTSGTFLIPSTVALNSAIQHFNTASSVLTDWLFTGRGRIGWGDDHWLLYATGGVAVTHASVSTTLAFSPPFVDTAAVSSTRTGWTAGAGFEYALNRNWSVKGEYLYLDFGSLNAPGVVAGNPALGPSCCFSTSTRLTANIARIGVNYRFGGPVVANY